jgi:ABC-type multidrug transport system ATPase subunit
LRLCVTVETLSAGAIGWQSAPLRKSICSRFGYAPQRIDFPAYLSGLDFLLHVAVLKRLALEPAKLQALTLIDHLGLKRDSATLIATYSGAMRRRQGLAQAFLGAPERLVFASAQSDWPGVEPRSDFPADPLRRALVVEIG